MAALFRVRSEIGEPVALNSVLYWFTSPWTKTVGFPIETFGNDEKELDPARKHTEKTIRDRF